MNALPPLLLLVVISLGLAAADFSDIDSRPVQPEIKKEKSIFDIISDVKKTSSLGRTGEKSKVKLTEGDIAQSDDSEVGVGRSANEENIVLTWPRKLWRTRVIPYKIENYNQNTKEWNAIMSAMKVIESKTCLKYRPFRYTDKSWIRIYSGNSCYSIIGRSLNFGATDVSLPPHCVVAESLIIHELMHALGFFHEQSRRDRDNYVYIYKFNIQQGQESNFEKARKDYYDTFDQPYDYKSIMHYTRTTFTKAGGDTIQARYDSNLELGGQAMTKYDIVKINAMYHCHEKRGTIWSEWSDWSQCIKNWRGCYRNKFRICLADSLTSCPDATKWGVHSMVQKCPDASLCSIERFDGFWSQWSSWSACTKRCDKGTKRRSRKCDSPKPSNGGLPCKGPASDTETCIRQKCRKSSLDTNFDQDMGMWTNVNSRKDTTAWRRAKGRGNNVSGPDGDHTDGSGSYLLVSSRGGKHFQRATLVSRSLSGTKCISFAYCMDGKNMGKLDIFAQTDKKEWFNYPFLKKGHQGKGWRHAEVSMGDSEWKANTYKFYFQATTLISPYSDIALDDIFIEEGSCGSNKPNPGTVTGTKPNPGTGTGSKVTIGCTNKDKLCETWAKIGECHLNPSFMVKQKNCCLACRGMDDCDSKVYSNECDAWASKGECKKNDRWMWKNCCKACKKQGKCQNKNAKCKLWAKNGYCRNPKNNVFMWKNCCSACTEDWKTGASCVDKNSECGAWSRMTTNECKRNEAWMLLNCCKSCKAVKG